MRTTESILILSLIFVFLIPSPDLKGQDITRSVIGNNGTYYSNLIFGDLHFTVGEIAVSQLETGLTLDEGFHHSYYELVVDTKEISPQNWQVNVFPNPTSDIIRINLSENATTQLFLYNSIGQLMRQKSFQSSTKIIDLNNLPAGTYWLHLSDNEGRKGIFKIQKISI